MHPILDKLKKDGVRKIKLGIFDVDGVFRGKYVNMKKFTSALENGLGFCDVVFGWDVADELYDKPTVTGWHTGYPDAPAVIDVNSYRKIPWEPETFNILMESLTLPVRQPQIPNSSGGPVPGNSVKLFCRKLQIWVLW